MILAYFGGLRHNELMNLQLEKMRISEDGVTVTHERSKQRSDKKSTNFLIPRTSSGTNYAAIIENYISIVKDELGKFSGRFLFTGRQASFVTQPMGKNMISTVPKEMARWLKKENTEEFTFHSFRRSSATHAADSGATANQLMDFYGWSNSKVAQEYISTSKVAVKNMASKLIPATEPEAVDSENSKPDGATEKFMSIRAESSSRLIQNNKQVFFIQNFNGTLNC